MIRGTITDHTASIVIEIIGSSTREVEAVLDTGFGGGLRVPDGFFASCGLEPMGSASCRLADDSTTRDSPTTLGRVVWLGSQVEIDLTEFGSEVLVGMGLLEGTTITLDPPLVTVASVRR